MLRFNNGEIKVELFEGEVLVHFSSSVFVVSVVMPADVCLWFQADLFRA